LDSGVVCVCVVRLVAVWERDVADWLGCLF